MTIKSILVQAEAAAEPRIRTAAALARNQGARLIGIGVEMFQPLMVSDPYGYAQGAWLETAREQVEKDLEKAQQAFERCAAGTDHEWRRLVDLPTPTLAGAARAADLIVVGGVQLDGRDGHRSAVVGELIIRAGRPVLVAPPSGGELIGARAVVAWKETREARRATLDALPLLSRAEDVLVVSVVPEREVKSAEVQTADVAAWLRTHGLPARSKVVTGFDKDACGELQLQAMSAHADLIVSGGYGHNRFTEWLLGGVTRGLLENPQQFVFFSH